MPAKQRGKTWPWKKVMRQESDGHFAPCRVRGCYTEGPQAAWLQRQRFYFVTVLQAGNPESTRRQGWSLPRPRSSCVDGRLPCLRVCVQTSSHRDTCQIGLVATLTTALKNLQKNANKNIHKILHVIFRLLKQPKKCAIDSLGVYGSQVKKPLLQ